VYCRLVPDDVDKCWAVYTATMRPVLFMAVAANVLAIPATETKVVPLKLVEASEVSSVTSPLTNRESLRVGRLESFAVYRLDFRPCWYHLSRNPGASLYARPTAIDRRDGSCGCRIQPGDRV
ncbi:unnamed protein product, partial [Ectocarpus sp. 8 AP-2014]